MMSYQMIVRLLILVSMMVANANSMTMPEAMHYASFLKCDTTPTHQYSNNYKCIDYAIAGYKNGSLHGFDLYYAVIIPKTDSMELGHCLLASEFQGKYILWDPAMNLAVTDYYRKKDCTVVVLDPSQVRRISIGLLDWGSKAEIDKFQSNNKDKLSSYDFNLEIEGMVV